MAVVGAAVHEPSARDALRAIQEADRLGVPEVWLTTGAAADALVVFAAAAVTTGTIRLGTAIVPTFPRHPLVVAQQAADLAQLAPGRFTLGLGPSHGGSVEGRYGLSYHRPLEQLREFVSVVKGALTGEQLDFEGRRFTVHGRLAHPGDVPVMISALREGSFQLAGEVADGAITWVCPAPYLRRVALPALERGAAMQSRPVPPLVAHAFLCLTSDRATVREAASRGMAGYPRLPNYVAMFEAAGFPEARQGAWSDPMLDAVLVWGAEQQAAEAVHRFLDTSGAQRLILSILSPPREDREDATRRALQWVAAL